MKILAIDLGKFKSVACLFDTATNQATYETIPMFQSVIENLLHQSQAEQVVIETCTNSGWVDDICQTQGYGVLVANPNQEAWQWRNVKRKTDKDDALKLAKLAVLDQIHPVHVPSASTRQYRRLVKYRKTLVWRMNQIHNSIRALLMAQGMTMPSRAKAWTIEGIKALRQHCNPIAECSIDELWKGELDLELTLLDHLEDQHDQVEKQLNQLAKHEEQVQRLMTIPGVGRRTAEVIFTALDKPERFANARQVSAYAGLVPDQRQSGQTNKLGSITRRGSRLLRGALVEVSWMLLRFNPWAQKTYERICGGQKTRKKTAIVALARKLLVRCWAMLRDKQAWNPDGSPIPVSTTNG
ncbi:MAG: IS110 family transposase [Leptolyngbyaceae cyanobacterium SU_3_3]|nr:IS110 family transposase [Leptolyngbyaceae cyanobacterium SU_3_3]NJR51284.1 IS110 family transposase [Leptolyngbyaceae cyanobacterium CSU_1_3]